VHVLWLYPNSVIYSLASGLERRRDVVLPRQVKQVLLDGRGQWLHEATSFAHVLGRVEQTVAFVRLFSHDVLRIHSTHVARLPFRAGSIPQLSQAVRLSNRDLGVLVNSHSVAHGGPRIASAHRTFL
jgi:hypothetical protein